MGVPGYIYLLRAKDRIDRDFAEPLGIDAPATDDCRATLQQLSARGVQFLQEPAERPYGVEATFP